MNCNCSRIWRYGRVTLRHIVRSSSNQNRSQSGNQSVRWLWASVGQQVATQPPSGSVLSSASLYAHPQIDEAAARQSVRLSPAYLLVSGRSADGTSHLIRSAQYLQKELPVRLAHRVRDCRSLPFVVAIHPAIMSIQDLYIRSFYALQRYPQIETLEQEAAFTRMIMDLLDHHKEVVQKLAEGFRACSRYLEPAAARTFLDNTLTGRLGIRLLAEQHVGLHDNSKKNYVGIVCTNFSPKAVIEKRYEFSRKMCETRYGRCPEMRLRGDLNDTFPYIPAPFEYIVGELLKNAVRAVAERHANSATLPPISVTLVKNDVEFVVRVSDRGGGIRTDSRDKIWQYGFTTDTTQAEPLSGSSSAFAQLTQTAELNLGQAVLSGYGFGLPMSAAFASYLGGQLSVESMSSYGTDTYLRLPLIDTDRESFRI